MQAPDQNIITHLMGEQPIVEARSAIADTFAGRIHVEWDATAPVTPFGQLPFFIDYLKQAGLFDAWVADCPLSLTSPNAPSKRDLLGTVMLSVLAGHRRYAHITVLRCDAVNPSLLGMRKVVSEDSVRRGLAKIDPATGLPWLQNHLDYCTTPLLSEPWVLDMDSTVKTLYGRQEGAEVGYNPHKPGRPSHAYHTYMLSSLRLVLRVDVLPGDQYNVAHATDGLWTLLDHLGPTCRPSLLRGDKSWGIERVMARAEQSDLMWTVPRVNCQLKHSPALRSNVGHASRHGASRCDRRTGRPVPVSHRIGGCSCCSDGHLFPGGWRSFGSLVSIESPRLLRSNGRACGAAFGAAPSVRTSVSWWDYIATLQILSSDGIRHCQLEPMPTSRPLLAMAFRATRDSYTCRRSSNLARCKARVTAKRIYRPQSICRYTEAIADVGKNLSASEKRSGQLRPYVRPVDASFVAGHHGCALTCQAPIWLAGSEPTSLYGIA
jgi:hypothetical protein